MRLAPLRELDRRLDVIEANCSSLKAIRSLIAEETGSSPVGSSTHELLTSLKNSLGVVDRRELDYSALVIQLYGAIENYIEALAREVASCLNLSVALFSNLPERTRTGHRSVSMAALEAHQKSRYRGEFSFADILSGLASCEDNVVGYALNIECFSMHSANVRRQTINELFSNLGFPDIAARASQHPSVIDMLSKFGRQLTDAFFVWDDLTERRNGVAHGVVIESDNMITLEGFAEYVAAIRCIGTALFDALLVEVVKVSMPPYKQPLGTPFATHRSDHILCFRPSGPTTIEIDSRLVWKRGDGEWATARVISLEVENKPVDSFHGAPERDFGVGVSVGCRPSPDGCFVVTT